MGVEDIFARLLLCHLAHKVVHPEARFGRNSSGRQKKRAVEESVEAVASVVLVRRENTRRSLDREIADEDG